MDTEKRRRTWKKKKVRKDDQQLALDVMLDEEGKPGSEPDMIWGEKVRRKIEAGVGR